MKQLIKISLFVLASLYITSCRTKDNTTVTPATADTNAVKVELFNVVGNSALNLGNQWYINEHGDSFMVTKLNYYISNIVLHGDTSFTESDSYHLAIEGTSSTMSFDVHGVPYGTYSSITFMIGVDSAHNVTGAQSGALDPVNNMFWSWTTGYIMLKFEGTSPKSPNANGAIALHAGGFSGANNVLKTVTLTFPSPITVDKNGENHIHLQANVLAMFKSPNVIDFSVTNGIHMPGPDAKAFADNYANMFSCPFAGK